MNTIEQNNNTFKNWGEKYLKRKQGKVSYSQIRNLRAYLSHTYKYIGDMPINKITVDHLDDIMDALTEKNPNTQKPASRQYLINVRNAASAVFEWAIDRDVICKNPARKIEISKYAPQAKRRALTELEQKLIICTPHRARIGALIMMLAGLRKGELIPLTWDDIDLDNLVIKITKSVEIRGDANRYVIKNGTKNGKWGRLISIPIDLALEIQKAKEAAKSRYVCCKSNGEMHSPTSWRCMWRNYINTIVRINPPAKQTGIQDITAHYLRHTYATLLYISGVDVLTASKLLGHSNIKTTIEIYTHLEETMVAKSVDKLDEYITHKFFR